MSSGTRVALIHGSATHAFSYVSALMSDMFLPVFCTHCVDGPAAAEAGTGTGKVTAGGWVGLDVLDGPAAD